MSYSIEIIYKPNSAKLFLDRHLVFTIQPEKPKKTLPWFLPDFDALNSSTEVIAKITRQSCFFNKQFANILFVAGGKIIVLYKNRFSVRNIWGKLDDTDYLIRFNYQQDATEFYVNGELIANFFIRQPKGFDWDTYQINFNLEEKYGHHAFAIFCFMFPAIRELDY